MADVENIYKTQSGHSHSAGLQAVYAAGVAAGLASAVEKMQEAVDAGPAEAPLETTETTPTDGEGEIAPII